MTAKRIIPCLDVDAGRVVKGVRFQELRDAGDPAALAAFYDQQGADEVVFLDITATSEGRRILLDAVARTADQVFIPLTVGGGVRSVADMAELLTHGADKVSLNSAALADPPRRSTRAGAMGLIAGRCSVTAVAAPQGATRWSGRRKAWRTARTSTSCIRSRRSEASSPSRRVTTRPQRRPRAAP